MGTVPVTRPVKKDRMVMYVGGFLVALVAVVAIFGAAVMYNMTNNWNNDQSMSHVTMSVQSVAWTNSTEHPAPSGERYLLVTAVLHSGRSGDIALSPAQFILSTSQGPIYGYAPQVSPVMQSRLLQGSDQTIMLAFLIPEDAIPTMLTLSIAEESGMHVHAPI
jgi:hypothetical protein